MANLYLDLPVPLANGAGASVNTGSLGRTRTISYRGDIAGAVEVQVSENNIDFRTAHTFFGTGKITLDVAALWMRALVSNFQRGTAANLDVAANDDGGLGVMLPVTAGNGVGAPVDVSALGTFNTILCSGTFSGSVVVECSVDGVNYIDAASFGATGGLQSKSLVAQFMRTRRSGVGGTPGTPNITVAAINDPSPAGAGSPPTGAAGGDLGGTYPNPQVEGLTESGGPTSLTIGAIANGEALVRVGNTVVGQAIVAPATNPPVNVNASAAVLGAITARAAREDHKHSIDTAVAVELTDATNAAGASTSLARADHQHSHGSRGGGSLHATAVASVSAGFISAADQLKLNNAGVLTAAVPANVTKSVALAGVATESARADHKHDITTAAALELTDATNAEGVATSLARSDHTHSHGARGGGTLHAAATAGTAGFMSAADKTKLDASGTLASTPPAASDTTAAQIGVGTTAARADHKHLVSTAAPGAISIGDAAALGAGPNLARSDHQHSLAAPAAPVDIGTANSAGIATAPARADHVHNLPFGPVQTALGAATGPISVNSQLVTTGADPVSPTDLVTKRYVDRTFAEWIGIRYFAVDYDAGNDANLGYSDVSMAAAGAVALKTLERLRAIFPTEGHGQSAVIAIAARAGGAVYRNVANTLDDEFQLYGVSGYLYLLVRGTGTVATAGAVKFANDAADKIALGAQIVPGTNAAGYNPTGVPTAATFTCQLNGGGAPGLAAEPALLGKRIRFDAATTTVALRNICRMVHQTDPTTITVDTNLPAVPVLTDVFYLDEPATSVDRIQVNGYFGSTLANLPSFSAAGLVIAGIRMPNTTAGFVAFAARGIFANLRISFCESNSPGFTNCSWSTIATLTVNNQYVDELFATITAGTGYVCDGWGGTASQIGALVMSSIVSRLGRWQILGVAPGAFSIGSSGGCYMGAGILFQNCKSSGGTQNTVGGSLLGSNASATVRRTRLLGGFAGSCMSITNTHCFLRGIDIQNVGALNMISLFGLGTIAVINDVVGSTGNTGNGLNMTLNRNSVVLMGQLNANTFTGAAGQDIVGFGPTFYTHADVARTDVTDAYLNQVQGAASTKLGAVSAVTNNAVSNIGQYKVCRATASGLVQAAQADTAANAAGVVGVCQSAFTTVQTAMAVTGGGTWIQFDAAPSAGAIAYLSTATAGNAQVAVPALAGTNQKLRLGRVLAVSGTLGYVAFQPEVLAVLADGLA